MGEVPQVINSARVPGGFPNEAGPAPAKRRPITSEETTQATLWLDLRRGRRPGRLRFTREAPPRP